MASKHNDTAGGGALHSYVSTSSIDSIDGETTTTTTTTTTTLDMRTRTYNSNTQDGSIITASQQSSSDYMNQFYANHCIYLPYMAGWFLFSSLLSSYNKVLFGSGRYHFPCPLLLTSTHFLIQWLISYSLSNRCSDFFGGERVRTMSWSEFLQISIPCGVVSALDIGLSNMSLVRINLSLYTMIKSSSPVFVLIFAILFRLEKLSWGLFFVVFLITLGEYLVCAFGELDFDALGAVLCLGASICTGARWTLVQFKLTTLDPPLKGSIPTMRVLSPSMFVALFCIGIGVERPWDSLSPQTTPFFQDFEHGIETLMIGTVGGLLAMCMVYFEFCLIMKSSAVVLMIGGVIKELLTLYIGTVFFGDNLNAKNILGCSVVFSGVILYKCLFSMNKKKLPNERNRSNHEDQIALVPTGTEKAANVRSFSNNSSGSDSSDPVRMRKTLNGKHMDSSDII